MPFPQTEEALAGKKKQKKKNPRWTQRWRSSIHPTPPRGPFISSTHLSSVWRRGWRERRWWWKARRQWRWGRSPGRSSVASWPTWAQLSPSFSGLFLQALDAGLSAHLRSANGDVDSGRDSRSGGREIISHLSLWFSESWANQKTKHY